MTKEMRISKPPKNKNGLNNLVGFIPDDSKTIISLSEDIAFRTNADVIKAAKGVIWEIIFGKTVIESIKKVDKSAPLITISSRSFRTWLSHASESNPIITVKNDNESFLIIYLSIFFIL